MTTHFEIEYRFVRKGPRLMSDWNPWTMGRSKYSSNPHPHPYTTLRAAKRAVHALLTGGLGWRSDQFRIIRVTREVVA